MPLTLRSSSCALRTPRLAYKRRSKGGNSAGKSAVSSTSRRRSCICCFTRIIYRWSFLVFVEEFFHVFRRLVTRNKCAIAQHNCRSTANAKLDAKCVMVGNIHVAAGWCDALPAITSSNALFLSFAHQIAFISFSASLSSPWRGKAR